MGTDDIIQIRVGNTPVGIIGLNDALADVARDCSGRPDGDIAEELLSRLSKRNFIPERAKADYRDAFLREFKKHLGRPVEDAGTNGLDIKVLGPGCAQCDRLAQELMQLMAETGIAAGLEHVRDIKAIGRYGVMGTPALVINGEVKCVGSVPPRSKLTKWLKEAS